MTTSQKIQKLEKEMTELKSLFSALVPNDIEGIYKKSFINQVKKKASEKAVGEYKGKGSLLSLTK